METTNKLIEFTKWLFKSLFLVVIGLVSIGLIVSGIYKFINSEVVMIALKCNWGSVEILSTNKTTNNTTRYYLVKRKRFEDIPYALYSVDHDGTGYRSEDGVFLIDNYKNQEDNTYTFGTISEYDASYSHSFHRETLKGTIKSYGIKGNSISTNCSEISENEFNEYKNAKISEINNKRKF